MCRVLAYIGPDVPLENLLLKPENSLLNQALDPEGHPDLQLAGWGFGAWSEHLLAPEAPLLYRRPMAAFYDDNAPGIIPSLQASTMLAHVRASSYDASVVLSDENCHPFSYERTPWIIAQNGDLPSWRLLQRELLAHCTDEYLAQMAGDTDTEFLYVLLLSLLEGDDDASVQRAFEQMIGLVQRAMTDLDLVALAKFKIALVAPNRVIGVNAGLGHHGETRPEGDWLALRESGPGTDDYALSMLLEPLYYLMGRDIENDDTTYGFRDCTEEEATAVILASEPLTDSTEDWLRLDYGHIVFLENDGSTITRTVRTLDV